MERKNKVEFVDINTGEIFNYKGMLDQAYNEYDFDDCTNILTLDEYFAVYLNGTVRYDLNIPVTRKEYVTLATM